MNFLQKLTSKLRNKQRDDVPSKQVRRRSSSGRLSSHALNVECLESRDLLSSTPISELVVFGASESDAGNVHVATAGAFPASPYYEGRFTNGPNWVDHLADELGLERAAPSILGGDNFAVGGATTGDGFSGFAPNVGVQINGSEINEIDINGDGVPDVTIEGYLENNTPTGNELFVIQAGANDIRNNPFGDPSVPVENLVNHVRDLAAAGGKHFLVRNVGRLGDEPVLWLSPDLAPNADLLQGVLNGQAQAFNQLLASELNALASELDITIDQFDSFSAGNPAVLESFCGTQCRIVVWMFRDFTDVFDVF